MLNRLARAHAGELDEDEAEPTTEEIAAARQLFDGTGGGAAALARDADAGLSWVPPGISQQPAVLVDGKRLAPLYEAGTAQVFLAAAARACHRAGLHPSVISATGAGRGLTEDPAGWAGRNL